MTGIITVNHTVVKCQSEMKRMMLQLSCQQLQNVICSFGVCCLTNYASFTPLLLYLDSSFGWGEVIFFKSHNGYNGTYQYRKVTAFVHYKNIILLLLFKSFKVYCGLGTRVLDDWCGTVMLWGCCILYNYTLFVWMIHRDQKKIYDTSSKMMQRGTVYRGFTV